MSNASLPALIDKRVTLRGPREEDFAARLRLGTDVEIFRMYGGNRSDLRPMTEEVARRWVGRLLDHDYAWIIEAGTLIGHVRLDESWPPAIPGHFAAIATALAKGSMRWSTSSMMRSRSSSCW